MWIMAHCPYCDKEFEYDDEEMEEILEAIAVVIAFRHRQVGFGALKRAADNLARLKKKYGVE